MKHTFLTSLAAAICLTGCVGYYEPKPGTGAEELSASVAAAQTAKEERIRAAGEAAAASEATWKQAQTDYLAELEARSPTRAKWFKGVLADPRVTFGMLEREVALLVHHSKLGSITKSVVSSQGSEVVSTWDGVVLGGPSLPDVNGGHNAPLKLTFTAGKVTAVVSPQL